MKLNGAAEKAVCDPRLPLGVCWVMWTGLSSLLWIMIAVALRGSGFFT